MFEGSAVALLSTDGWHFTAPIFIGDTETCTVEILSTRPTSKVDFGIVERQVTLHNHHGEIAQSGRMDLMVARRPE
ncbi:hotdog family protein [Rathayibacter soli]|uniref:hypothetical protein n=1 Tax=Rathayibacter soli TaxID=3144168 RepID=UPI0027E5653F|nr:hypothetical protein [Glaciibacter superstes]